MGSNPTLGSTFMIHKTRRAARHCSYCNKFFKPCNGRLDSQMDLCSNACIEALYHEERIQKFFRGELKDRWVIRRLILEMGVAYQCDICQLTEWTGQPIPLNLDHIDGCAANNAPENFRFLCPNCDSLTEFHKNKNRGRFRKSLGLQ